MGAAGRADGVAPFPADTDLFGRPDQQTMLSFRVTDLDAMPAQLRAAGASVDDGICEASFGRFGHAVDPDGNRFPLWEPSGTPRTWSRDSVRPVGRT
jgi:predicted enzyme related to lactoylglutathione lyase